MADFPKKVEINRNGVVVHSQVNDQDELDCLGSWAGNMCMAYYQSHGLMGEKVTVRTLED